MTKYIYHSEKTKTTCNECSKNNGKVFYDYDDIPKPPIHPNCKCWVEIVQTQDSNENECDCKDRLEIEVNTINNAIENTKNLIEAIDSKAHDFQIDFETIAKLLERIYLKRDIIEEELGIHDANCENNVDNLYKEITQNIINIEQLNKKQEELETKLYEIRRNLVEFEKEAKIHLIDIDEMKQSYFDPTYHTIEQCKLNDKLKPLTNKTKQFCESINNYSIEFNNVKEQATNIKNAMKAAEECLKVIEERKKIVCFCTKIAPGAESFYYTGAGASNLIAHDKLLLSNANLQNAMHDFKEAKKNENAVVLNSRDEIKNKDINANLVDIGVPKNSRGVYYNQNSKESEKIANSKKIKEFIADNYSVIKNNEFEGYAKLDFDLKGDKDLYLALQHCRLINPKITPDGYFEATIIDYYDFEYRDVNKDDKWLTRRAKGINNWGDSMQKKEFLENYYIIYSIRVKV